MPKTPWLIECFNFYGEYPYPARPSTTRVFFGYFALPERGSLEKFWLVVFPKGLKYSYMIYLILTTEQERPLTFKVFLIFHGYADYHWNVTEFFTGIWGLSHSLFEMKFWMLQNVRRLQRFRNTFDCCYPLRIEISFKINNLRLKHETRDAIFSKKNSSYFALPNACLHTPFSISAKLIRFRNCCFD